MDEYLACSDLCEENGFARQAELLRSISGNGIRAFVVVERGSEYNDNIYDPQKFGEPRTIYLDRAEAERVARERDAAWHRENNILDFCYELGDVTKLTESQLSSKIAEILGQDYQLPNDGKPTYSWSEGPLVPGPVTDEQMRKIADLFTLKFYYVVETEFASPDRVSKEGRP